MMTDDGKARVVFVGPDGPWPIANKWCTTQLGSCLLYTYETEAEARIDAKRQRRPRRPRATT